MWMHKHPLTDEYVWHAVDAHFGDSIPYKAILKMLTETKGKFPDNITAQLHYNESYDNLFGIYDHSQQRSDLPMPEVAVHWAEDTSEDSPLYESFQSYMDNDILKYTGMNYADFLAMPSDMVRYITEKCLDMTQKRVESEKAQYEKALAEKNAALQGMPR